MRNQVGMLAERATRGWCMIGPLASAFALDPSSTRRRPGIAVECPCHTLRFPVAVIMQRTPLANRWVSERWEPVAVLPPVAPMTSAVRMPRRSAFATTPRATQWRFDGHALELHRSEAEGYYLNLVAPEPKVFVMWRMHDDAADAAGASR